MTSPHRDSKDVSEKDEINMEHVDGIQPSNSNPQNSDFKDSRDILWSRIDEQSTLIYTLKKRADETLVRYQALQQVNSDLEDQLALCQKELEDERKRADMLKSRFTDLAANNQGIIHFMEEHKNQNMELKEEVKRLQLENDSLFSQKLHDKEMLVKKLLQENKLLRDKCTANEQKFSEKIAESESNLREQAVQHRVKELSLLDQLLDAQNQQRNAEESCEDLKLKLSEAQEEHALKETSLKETIAHLTCERKKLLDISMERGKSIQEKQEKIQEMETKWKNEEKAKIEAQKRFALDAKAVDIDTRVKYLQNALDKSMSELQKLNEDFDAFKEHSNNLLTQEKNLNQKLRHVIG
ncbi:coiled-coil domain-containing protein 89 [Poecilia latipinna]|uniref:coiled-coil domain-containing protein 89 n=1 Tax=Poecilia latipinna TaxID=48699 RepID=UPI00072EA4E8|nr:PREDICTED: coiled-coil domain-containing protein 89-like [Poecilia latipinna]